MGRGLKNCDAFGRRVTLTYQGEGYYTTWVGVMMTTVCIVIYLGLVGYRLTEFFMLSDATPKQGQQNWHEDEAIDVSRLGFDFAVEKIDPSYGAVKAYTVSWPGVSTEQID